jgi:predicted nucleotidyltransferase
MVRGIKGHWIIPGWRPSKGSTGWLSPAGDAWRYMKLMIIERHINDFLVTMLKKFPGIYEIWFIGSRANNEDIRYTSDWDFIIRCEKEVFSFLSKDVELRERAKFLKIDLLVEVGEKFTSPWESHCITKNELQWSTLSRSEAKYWGAKTRERTADEIISLTDWEKYAIDHGADDSIDISGWRLAKKIWPAEFKSHKTLG